MDNSWIKLHRKFLNSPLWRYAIFAKMPHLISLWVYLLASADWEEKKWYDGKQETIIPRGSFITSLAHLAKRTSITVQQTRTALQHLVNMDMITHKITNKWTQLWIINWDKYQMRDNSNNTQDNIPITNEQQTDNKPITTTKEYKNIRIKEKRDTSSNYLLNIPSNDLAEFTLSFVCTDCQVISKGQSLFDYCKSNGRSYKDYKAFLRNALRKDFGERIEIQPYMNDLPQGISEVGLEKLRVMKRKTLGNKFSN